MKPETCWYRVFGAGANAPDFSAFRASRRMREDDHGWYQIHFPLLSGDIELNRWLPEEDGIHPELNTWAAWIDANSDSDMTALQQHVKLTTQLFTWAVDPLAVDAVSFSELLCRFLSAAVAGVYQIDGQGFFKADGTLLVRETS
jgi:hypothetical protein